MSLTGSGAKKARTINGLAAIASEMELRESVRFIEIVFVASFDLAFAR
jgi:hypothetical protein